MSLVPTLGRKCLEDLCEFKASQGYTVRLVLQVRTRGWRDGSALKNTRYYPEKYVVAHNYL